jgi:hypothetical protein
LQAAFFGLAIPAAARGDREELQVVVAAMLLGMRVAAGRPLEGAPARLQDS